MFGKTIIFAFRRMWKQPIFTGINGIGLTLGITAFLFMLQYVVFQWSFNDSFSNTALKYRLLDAVEGNELNSYTVPGMVPLVKENIPGVELASRFMSGIGSGVIIIEDKAGARKNVFREDDLAFVDDDFLKLFDLPTLNGKPALVQPNTMVLTEAAALQYFQTLDVIGESLKLVNQFGEHAFQITGVVQDFPDNSDIKTNVLASMSTFESKEYIGRNTWMDINTLNSSFVLSFFGLTNPEVGENLTKYWERVLMENSNFDTKINAALQSFAEMHLDKGERALLPTFGDAKLVWFLLIIAILILTIAWINYINLSTAQALKKARSVSVRKVIGAKRWHLISQQLAETFLLAAGSVLMGIMLCVLLQPFFNYLVDYPLDISLLLNWKFILGIFTFLVLTSFLAGFYVAIVLTGFDPSVMLKGSFARSRKGILVRKSLVTLQFAISIAFIAGTGIMLLQLNFMQTKDLGFETERRLAILGPADFSAETSRKRTSFLDKIDQLPFVNQYTVAGGIPGRGVNFGFKMSQDKEQLKEEKNSYSMVFVDENYFDLFDIDIIAGSAPTAAMVEKGWWETKKIILNETAAKQLGFENPADALQQVLYQQNNGTIEEIEVYAIVEDYNHESLHAEMMPLVFGPGKSHVWFTLLLNEEANSEQLASLEALYQEHFPKNPFIYRFVEDYYNQFYEADRRLGQLISTATFLAIFISCLGLFGLIAYTVEQRTKEIGIRKVLGASVTNIISLFTKDFVPLVLFAIIIASPIAYYFMQGWLQDFAYRIDIQWWIFALSGFVAVGIALLTVSFQSIKAALTNPVESLRNE